MNGNLPPRLKINLSIENYATNLRKPRVEGEVGETRGWGWGNGEGGRNKRMGRG
jgi:hypothetical protein